MKRLFLSTFLVCMVAFCVAEEVELLSETFATGFGTFTLDEQKYAGNTHSSQWYINTSYACAYINANGQSSSRGASDCKLVSPSIDCSGMKEVVLSFTHATFSGSATADLDYLLLEATKDGATWSKITIPNWPTAKWGYVTCGVDLSDYISTTMQFRFRYISTDAYAPAWEVKDVVVYGEEEEEEEKECLFKSMEGKCGNDLLVALYDMINNHTVLSYDQVRADKAKVDLRSDGKIWDMYSDCEQSTGNYCGAREDYAACECYNREHMLPKSWWGGTTTVGAYTDLYNVIPVDFEANDARQAWIYDEVSSSTWTNGVSKLGQSVMYAQEANAFEPADEYKGDIARTYFYMITCYKDLSFTAGGKGFRYFNDGTATLKDAPLNLLLKWHRNDPVSEKELTRNDKVENKQGNRNPFVDDPSLVEHIWGKNKYFGYSCSGEVDTTNVPGAITCQQARTLASALSSGSYSTEEYTVQGYVTYATKSYQASYGNQNYYIDDNQGTTQTFYAYQCTAPYEVKVGDKVAVTGKLLNYNGTYEIKKGTTKLLYRGEPTWVVESPMDAADMECAGPVYSLMGRKVADLLEGLPEGVYMVLCGGVYKKVIVK